MAAISPTIELGTDYAVVTWELTGDDTGNPVRMQGFTRISAQAEGDGSAAVISASLDGENFNALSEDPWEDIVDLPLARHYSVSSVTGGTDNVVTLFGVKG